MKKLTSIKSLTLVLIGCGLASVAGAAEAKSEVKVFWKITGELEEACSCRAACPCWFKSLPSRMTCDGTQVIFITKGSYSKTLLDGLGVG